MVQSCLNSVWKGGLEPAFPLLFHDYPEYHFLSQCHIPCRSCQEILGFSQKLTLTVFPSNPGSQEYLGLSLVPLPQPSLWQVLERMG